MIQAFFAYYWDDAIVVRTFGEPLAFYGMVLDDGHASDVVAGTLRARDVPVPPHPTYGEWVDGGRVRTRYDFRSRTLIAQTGTREEAKS